MIVYQYPARHNKRWEQLVKPILNKDGESRVFLDLGCNEGFYMKKAINYGYKAIGIEQEPWYIDRADNTLDIRQGDINTFKSNHACKFPCAYVTLLSNVYYHQSPEQIASLLLNLLYSTNYLIITGRRRNTRVKTDPRREYLVSMIEGWRIVKETKGTKFYSLLLRSPRLGEYDVDKLYEATHNFTIKTDGVDDFFPSFNDFVRKTIDNPDFDPSAHPFMDYQKRRGWSYRLGRCWDYKELVRDIQKNGLTEPLRVVGNHLKDGHHRLVIAKELGYKRIVCRRFKK